MPHFRLLAFSKNGPSCTDCLQKSRCLIANGNIPVISEWPVSGLSWHNGNQAHCSPDQTFPSDLPRPEDDGACDHLKGSTFPSISLPSTAGDSIDPSTLTGLTVLFCYPRTGGPNETITEDWNAIPGARGCTPQACSFLDAFKEFTELGAKHIFGASTQDTSYQQEVRERVHLPYQLLSDEGLEMVDKLKLPTFEWQGKKLIKRMSMAIEDGKIIKVWYPVFPPNESANEVLKWLKSEYKGQK